MKTILIILLFFIGLLATGCNKQSNINLDQGVALINAIIIDGTSDYYIEDGVLLYKNGKIEQVGSKDSIEIPDNYIQKDLEGNTVLPGFINAHVHHAFSEKQLKKWVKSGVTTVRALSSSGSTVSSYIDITKKLNQNINIASLVISTPIITAPGGYGTVYIETKEDAINVVNDYVNKGVDIIKFSIEDNCQQRTWTLMNQENINALVEAAHNNGKRVAVHLTWSRNLKYAIEASVDEISHMVVDQLSDELIIQMVEKNIYWVPTLELWRKVSIIHPVNYDDIAISNLSSFYQAGGNIALGTDYAGYTGEFDRGFPITEVMLMKEAGMTNIDIIIAGTKNAAIVCDRVDTIGTLEVGKDADIFVVEGNPLDDISALTKPYMVVHKGLIIN